MAKTRKFDVMLDSVQLRDRRVFALLVRALLSQLLAINVGARKRGEVPPLYSTRVYFRPEPPGVETFRDAVNTYRMGHGDCAHLAAWRAADLIVKGEKASLAVKYPKAGQRLFHVVVRRENRAIEDPSTVLKPRS